MEYLYDLKEKMERELKEISEKPEMGAGDLELAHKLTDTIKNIDKICMLEEGGYSEDDGGGSYGRGYSSANRGKHYVRGHYSRDGGSYDGGGYSSRRGGSGRNGASYRGGSRGGSSYRGGNYSREGGTEEMMEHVRMAIDAAPEEYKEDFRRFMQEIEG